MPATDEFNVNAWLDVNTQVIFLGAKETYKADADLLSLLKYMVMASRRGKRLWLLCYEGYLLWDSTMKREANVLSGVATRFTGRMVVRSNFEEPFRI